MSKFHLILDKYRTHSFSERDKGDRFERLIQAYLQSDPKDWSKEVENSKYILDLLQSVINVSVQTVDIIDELPRVKFD